MKEQRNFDDCGRERKSRERERAICRERVMRAKLHALDRKRSETGEERVLYKGRGPFTRVHVHPNWSQTTGCHELTWQYPSHFLNSPICP